MTRLMYFLLTDEELVQLLKPGKVEIVSGLPADSTLVVANYDFLRRGFAVRVYSEQFEEVKEGEMIPEISSQAITLRRMEADYSGQ